MKTTLEQRKKEETPPFGRKGRITNGRNDHHCTREHTKHEAELWAPLCAAAGAGLWAGIAVLARMGMARIGAMELIFLFAPLVIVPLGMELGRVTGGTGWFEEVARLVQPLGGALAVVPCGFRRGGMPDWPLWGGRWFAC